MFIRQACFVGVYPPSSGIYTHTLDAAMGTVPCWQEFMLQVRICKVTDYSSYWLCKVNWYPFT